MKSPDAMQKMQNVFISYDLTLRQKSSKVRYDQNQVYGYFVWGKKLFKLLSNMEEFIYVIKKKICAMVAHAFNPSIQEAEAGGSL